MIRALSHDEQRRRPERGLHGHRAEQRASVDVRCDLTAATGQIFNGNQNSLTGRFIQQPRQVGARLVGPDERLMSRQTLDVNVHTHQLAIR